MSAVTRCPAGHILGDAARVFGCPLCHPPHGRRRITAAQHDARGGTR